MPRVDPSVWWSFKLCFEVRKRMEVEVSGIRRGRDGGECYGAISSDLGSLAFLGVSQSGRLLVVMISQVVFFAIEEFEFLSVICMTSWHNLSSSYSFSLMVLPYCQVPLFLSCSPCLSPKRVLSTSVPVDRLVIGPRLSHHIGHCVE